MCSVISKNIMSYYLICFIERELKEIILLIKPLTKDIREFEKME